MKKGLRQGRPKTGSFGDPYPDEDFCTAEPEDTRSHVRRMLFAVLIAVILALLLAITLNLIVCLSQLGRMRSLEDSLEDTDRDYDCIIVLGCGVWGETASPLLSDRLDQAVSLYKAGIAPKILMSGDHGREGYDEVAVMRRYCLERGVPSEDIFLDHAGFSTYETMWRASKVFGVRKAVVVTQKYHLFRALYDAHAFGIEVRGTIATGHSFQSLPLWEARECFARIKDFFWCLAKPDATYGGEAIDIHGNGEVTLD